jgi:hypothetical protein
VPQTPGSLLHHACLVTTTAHRWSAAPPAACWCRCSGSEVGYYAGCVRTWRQLEQQRPGCIPQRAQRVIAAMEQLLAGFPLHDPLVRAARSSDMLGPPLTGATGLPSCTPPLCSKGGGGGAPPGSVGWQCAWATPPAPALAAGRGAARLAGGVEGQVQSSCCQPGEGGRVPGAARFPAGQQRAARAGPVVLRARCAGVHGATRAAVARAPPQRQLKHAAPAGLILLASIDSVVAGSWGRGGQLSTSVVVSMLLQSAGAAALAAQPRLPAARSRHHH